MNEIPEALIQPSLYMWNGTILVVNKIVQAQVHSHNAIQITIALNRPFLLKTDANWQSYNAAVVNSNRPHQFDGGDGWQLFILLEAETSIARAIRQKLLQNNPVSAFHYQKDESFMRLMKAQSADKGEAVALAQQVFLGVIGQIIGERQQFVPMDDRVRRIIEEIRACPEQPAGIDAFAKEACLTKSRLIHLFKEQMGVSMRSYILWSRLLMAVRLAAQGVSFTDAAYKTGFTDSPHLSHTFKRMFGVTLSDLLKDSSYIQFFIAPL